MSDAGDLEGRAILARYQLRRHVAVTRYRRGQLAGVVMPGVNPL